MSTDTMEAPAETTQDDKSKKGKPKGIDYMKVNELAAGSLEDLPSDFVFGKHNGLTKSDFSDELYFARYKLWHHQQRAAKVQEDVDNAQAVLNDLEKYESKEKRELAAKARRAQAKFKSIMAEMKSEDLDFADLLEDLVTDVDAAE